MMKKSLFSCSAGLLSALWCSVSLAALPAPTVEAKAKSDAAKAKTAWSDKLAAYQLCQAQNKVAAAYLKGRETKALPLMPPCADPGPYQAPVSTPPPVVAAKP
ncbi:MULTISPECIES: hypothetical protein [unclassified Undibacterium]|uniref:hypothetical protein n=2 Tax=unclassified Undibacterium TaxID=2630295 RepID=UPI002AC8D3CC|nr:MULTISPECIES: hypothetical protein [unclassified Undibacterium]MEB0141035.1 hypothetical protein [Undibacterium sp. CCC2.1]MEB0174009.1 hypothetical protein [Undibacterium sp. CCC1.1]MEB0177965.1 hypothetical protein [Undibacterium sp. CCC3.4]WPX42187.1 hypothetical protein RHM61_12325 [Undibacterium sp. CCC3.4]